MNVKRLVSFVPIVGLFLALAMSIGLGLAYGTTSPVQPASSEEKAQALSLDLSQTDGLTEPWTTARNAVTWQDFSSGLPGTGSAGGIAFGDYDGDGLADLFVGVADIGIQLFRGSASSWVGPVKVAGLPNTGAYHALALADLNHDGRPDIIAAGEDGVHAYLQVTVSDFQMVTLGDLSSVYGVAVGDLDNDGHLDVVAANHGAGSPGIHIFRNEDGAGQKWEESNITFEGTFWGVALADFDDDGKPDIAAASDTASGGVYVWKGNGSFGWTRADDGLPHGSGAWRGVVVGDFDGDGKLDLAATGNAGLQIWSGEGTGHWRASGAGLPSTGDYYGLAAGDLDNDGKLDIIAARGEGKGLEPWRNVIGDNWQMFVPLPTTSDNWWNVALADIDNDGILDLGATSQSGRGVGVWSGSGTSDPVDLTEISSLVSTTSPLALAVADVNWDGHLDIVATMGSNAGIRAWKGDGGRTWIECSTNLPITGSYQPLVLGQLTGNAYPDLIVGSADNTGIKAFSNQACVWTQFSTGLPTTGSYTALALADVDHDGKPELVAGGSSLGVGLRMWRYDAGTWSQIPGPTAEGIYSDLALADVNRDGLLDTVATSPVGLGVEVWLNRGAGLWRNVAVVPTGEFRTVAVGDLNNDGALDLIAAKDGSLDPSQLGMFVWRGNGAGESWQQVGAPLMAKRFVDLDLADFNHDGRLDILAPRSDGLDLWLNNGDGTWTQAVPGYIFGYFYTARFGHVEHDGTPDVVAAQFFGGIRMWVTGDVAPPSGWSGFAPTGWVTGSQSVSATVRVVDYGSGLKTGTAGYAYSTDAGVSWSGWITAEMTGTNGTYSSTITARAASFGQDSLTNHRNRIKFRVADVAGNVGLSGAYNVDVDTTAPSNPISVTGRTVGAWSRDPSSTMTWTGAADASSGVYGYSYGWSASSSYVPPATVLTTTVTQTATVPSDGNNWYFHVRTRDAAGNWASGASHFGPYRLDTTPPDNPIQWSYSISRDVWITTTNTVDAAWSGAQDDGIGGSGVYGYSRAWSAEPDTEPGTWLALPTNTATSPPLADGRHYFHLRTRDVAGNWAPDTYHAGPFKIDRTPPSSAVISPTGIVSGPLVLTFSGSDAGSGIYGYEWQYRDLTAGSNWVLGDWFWTYPDEVATLDARPGHTYQLRSRARDFAGNVEDWPQWPARTYDAEVTLAVDIQKDHTGALEVTQGVQTRDNSVVLIENRPTFVRFHVNSHSSDIETTARLQGWRGSQFLGEILPGNPNRKITVKAEPDRGQLDDSFWFQLPSDWLHGTVTLRAEANYDRRLGEFNYSDNVAMATVTFNYSPPMDLRLIDMCYEWNGSERRISPDDVTAVTTHLNRLFPISQLNLSTTTRIPCYESPPGMRDTVLPEVFAMKFFDVLNNNSIGLERFYGVVNDDYWAANDLKREGWGYVPGWAAVGAAGPNPSDSWTNDARYTGWIAGHELGHNYGQSHAPCGLPEEDSGNPNYPHPGADISPTHDEDAANAVFGFDIYNHTVFSPARKDFMSYCSPRWISDYGYTQLYTQMLVEKPQYAPAGSAPLARGEYLAVSGSIDPATHRVTLGRLYRLPDAWDLEPRVPGPYSIRLLDASGNTLADYSFTPRTNRSSDGGPAFALIGEFVPWVVGTTQVSIYQGGAEVASRLVSPNPPTVMVISPNGGESLGPSATFRWTASDQDGDPLVFTVLYSVDGGATWQVLAPNVAGNSLAVDTRRLAGTSRGRIRVVASDGVNTGSDDSNGDFVVARKAPELHLMSPRATTFDYGQTVAFVAEAFDREDGSLPDAAFTWTSSLDGPLGTGHNLATASLVTGTHVITIRVADGDGQQTQTATTVYVGVPTYQLYLPVVNQ